MGICLPWLKFLKTSKFKKHPGDQKVPGTFWYSGQAAVQYILMVGIASVAVLGVVQARFTAFQNTMESIKNQMATVIGGGKRLPKKWYQKEVEDYSSAVSALQSQESGQGTGGVGGGEFGVQSGDASVGEVSLGEGGESGRAEGEGKLPEGYGAGFYSGRADTGFATTSTSVGEWDVSVGSEATSEKKKAGKDVFGSADSDDVEYAESGGDKSGGFLGDRRRTAAEKSQDEKQVERKKAKSEAEEDAIALAKLKKISGSDAEQKRGGNIKLDWATLVKLILILVIIVILVIMIIGSVGGKERE